MVLLDNHLHAILTLPEGDTRYSARWGWIKKEFTKAYLAAGGIEQALSGSRIRQRRRGVLQRRFWEHTLRDEEDYARHFDYIHYTRLNMGTWNLCRIGLIQLFIAGLNKAFTSWIGAVRHLGLWTSMIWILLLWNKDVE